MPAVRRLSFAPKQKDMRVTDVKTGHFVFVPRADRPARYVEMRQELVNAGYDVEGTTIEVRGALAADGKLLATGTHQPFSLAGPVGRQASRSAEARRRGDRLRRMEG